MAEENLIKNELEALAELEKKLTKKEKKFVEELEKDGNGTKAALRAGYGTTEGSAATQSWRLLKKEHIREYKRLRAVAICRAFGESPESLLLDVIEIKRRCMQAVPVMEWDPNEKEWVESGEWRFDAKGAMKAIEYISDAIGAKISSSGENKFEVTINVTDGEAKE